MTVERGNLPNSEQCGGFVLTPALIIRLTLCRINIRRSRSRRPTDRPAWLKHSIYVRTYVLVLTSTCTVRYQIQTIGPESPARAPESLREGVHD